MKKIFAIVILVGISFLLVTCNSPNKPEPPVTNYDQAVNYSIKKLLASFEEVPLNKYPLTTKGSGKWNLTEASYWTSGFYPGCLWLANELKPDPIFKKNAILFTEGLEEQQFNTNSHDVGFMINNSYGLGYKQTNNEDYKEIILQTANSLATRFNDKVGCLQSWDGEFQVILDNMMNLEILFWASKNGGSQDLYDIAVSHANKTIETHLREDGGSYHVVHFNPETGEIIKKRSHQGYAEESTWARGHAWAIYGYTMCFRETQDSTYLETAIKLSNYFIDHLPSDYIPYWDFNLPDNFDKKFRDASAATIVLSAFLELRNYVDDSSKYDLVIEKIFNELLTNYISVNSNSSGIINHCAYNVNNDNPDDRDASTSWGDYYFLESLVRYKDFK